MNHNLETITAMLVSGKGILAADETVPTVTKRFDTLGIQSTEDSRRTYREMLFTATGLKEFVSCAITYDETIRQKSARGDAACPGAASRGIVPGIKVDTGAKPLAGWSGETVTEGLDGLRDRLAAYRDMGARFAKWRAVFRIADARPSQACVIANAHALGRYAALCQEQQLVPIVEPEVLMDGDHSIERCEAVTGAVLHAVFGALREQGVALECMLLKPNMVVPGQESSRSASVQEVAIATLRCLRRHVPALCRGSCSCLVVSRSGLPRSTQRNQSVARSQNPGQLLSPMGAPFRILRWKRGEVGTRTWRVASRRYITAPGAMVRPAEGHIPIKWRQNWWALAVRLIAASGMTTDLRGLPARPQTGSARCRDPEFNNTGSKGS